MLQENQNALEKYRPEFGKSIQDFFENKIEPCGDSITIDTARDGNPVLIVEREGQVHRLNSAFRPVQEADRWAAQYRFDCLENIVILFGFGNGIFLRSLKKILGENDKIIVYEPSVQTFQTVLEHVDISDIISDPCIRLVVENINAADFYFLMEQYLDWRNIDALCVCEHPGYRELYIEACTTFYKQVAECKELIHVIKHTDVHFAHATVINYIRNMWCHIQHANTLSDFVGKFPENFPAIIVAAGPSLDKNIEILKKAQGKAFILAVDTAVNMLLKHNVEFDAMISVDATKNQSYLTNESCKNIPLFCGFMTRPLFMNFHQGKKIIIIGSRFADTLYAEFGHPFLPINIGGSVATAAFATCEKLGFKNIVLIGQDLAYGDGVTHAGGVVKNIVNEEVGREEIDAWDGGKVKSRYDWIIYRNWFESEIQKMSGVRVIDATEGGALIRGTEVMTLSEVIEKYCIQDFPAKELLSKLEPTFTDEEYKEVRKAVVHIENELENIRRNSQDAVLLCEQVISLVKQCGAEVSVNKQAKKLSVLNDKIISWRTYQLLDYYVTDTAVDDLKEINRMTGNKENDLINTYISAKAMYESLIEAAKELKDVIRRNFYC